MASYLDGTGLGHLIEKIKAAFVAKADTAAVTGIDIDATPTSGSNNLVTSDGVYDALAGKQATLVSGTNIKTVNNTSLIGSGNVSVGTYSKPSGGIPASDLASGVIPDVSAFITKSVNDLANYYLKTETYTQTEVNQLIGAIQQFHYEIYASTSAVASPASNVLYLIGPTGSGADKYEEYVYSSGWVKIGDTSIDLSGYVTTTALNAALANYTTTTDLTTLLAGKQDKIDAQHKLDYSLIDNAPTIPAPEVFVATYGTTTYAEIIQALTDEKVVICISNGKVYYSTGLPSSGAAAIFTSIMQGEGRLVQCNSSNNWSGWNTNLEPQANKVSTIVGNESDTSKYPNTKAVADYVAANAEIFWAEYGTTTLQQIHDAYDAGQLVVCSYQNKHFILSTLADGWCYLTCEHGNVYYRISLIGSTWSLMQGTMEMQSNKVTSISSSSTDTQYPSAKVVYDSLESKQATLVSGTNIKTLNGTSLLGSGNISIQNGEPNAVLFTSQNLTDAQKQQARANINTLKPNYQGTVTPVTTNAETTQNKVTSLSSSNTDTEYPSAKAVYDAVTKVRATYGTSVQMGDDSNSVAILELSQKQIGLLNASDVMSVHFVVRDGFERVGKLQEWRYMLFDMYATKIRTYYNGRICINDIDYGSTSSWLNKYESETIYPDVFTIVIDRVRGIVKFYDKTTLISTLTDDGYKTGAFIDATKGIIAITGGDYATKFYDISVYDYDISKLYTRDQLIRFEQNVDGAFSQPVTYSGNFALSDGTYQTHIDGYGSGSGWTVTNNGATRTYSNSTTTTRLAAGYYMCPIELSAKSKRWEVDIEIESGVVAFSTMNDSGSAYISAFDENGNEVQDINNVGPGKYTLWGVVNSVNCWAVTRVSGDVVVKETERRYKLISCCIHIRGDVLYDGQLYDDEAGVFYPKYEDIQNINSRSGRSGTRPYRNPLQLSIPLKTIKTQQSSLPHYAGEMAIVNNKIYVGMPDYT